MVRAGHRVTMLTSPAQLVPGEIPQQGGLIRPTRIDGLDALVLMVSYRQEMSLPRRAWSFLGFMVLACWVVLTRPNVDLVYATSTPLTVAVPALLGRFLRRVPFFFEVRDLWPDIPIALGLLPNPVLRFAAKALEKLAYRHALVCVAVNPDVAREMARIAGKRLDVVVACNACDTDLFRPDARASASCAARIEGKVVAVHTGAMGRVNALDRILDAAAALHDEENLLFLLVGRGNERAHVIRRVARERLANVQIWDPMPKSELAGLLGEVDFGLMTVSPVPILEKNCANKFFDYLAAGLPVCLNYKGWQAELLERHGCGLSASQGDQQAFESAIRKLYGSASLRTEMAGRARRAAETELSRTAAVTPILRKLSEASDRLK